jgi:hypothetical protein
MDDSNKLQLSYHKKKLCKKKKEKHGLNYYTSKVGSFYYNMITPKLQTFPYLYIHCQGPKNSKKSTK